MSVVDGINGVWTVFIFLFVVEIIFYSLFVRMAQEALDGKK